MSEPLDLEAMEREWEAYGERPDGDAVLAMFAEIRALRSQVASLTAERDAIKEKWLAAEVLVALCPDGERAALESMIATERHDRLIAESERNAALARLEKARGLVLEFAANMGPGFFDSYPTLVKLRAALTGTDGSP